jgi:hypothetical protein
MAALLSLLSGLLLSALAFAFLAGAIARLGRSTLWAPLAAFLFLSLNIGVLYFGLRWLGGQNFFRPWASALGVTMSLLALALFMKGRRPEERHHG